MADVNESAVTKDILMMARVSSKFDLKDPKYAKATLNYIKREDPFKTKEIEDMFVKRMKMYADDNTSDTTCLVCRRFPAVNGVVCESCLNKVYPSGVAEQIFNMDSPMTENESLVIAGNMRESRNRWRRMAIIELGMIVGLAVFEVLRFILK